MIDEFGNGIGGVRVEAWDKDLGLNDHLGSPSIPLYGVAEFFAWSGQESADFPSVNFQGPAKASNSAA